MKASHILTHLEHKGNPRNLEAMDKFGINTRHAYGVQIPELRRLAKNIGPHHQMASELWRSRKHEAMILAAYIDDPVKVTELALLLQRPLLFLASSDAPVSSWSMAMVLRIDLALK